MFAWNRHYIFPISSRSFNDETDLIWLTLQHNTSGSLHIAPALPIPNVKTSFYNFIWLILNDVIVGTAIGAFLCQNNVILGQWLAEWLEVGPYCSAPPPQRSLTFDGFTTRSGRWT